MSEETERDIVDYVGQRLRRDYAVDDGTALPEGIARSLQKLRRSETARGAAGAGQPLGFAPDASAANPPATLAQSE